MAHTYTFQNTQLLGTRHQPLTCDTCPELQGEIQTAVSRQASAIDTLMQGLRDARDAHGDKYYDPFFGPGYKFHYEPKTATVTLTPQGYEGTDFVKTLSLSGRLQTAANLVFDKANDVWMNHKHDMPQLSTRSSRAKLRSRNLCPLCTDSDASVTPTRSRRHPHSSRRHHHADPRRTSSKVRGFAPSRFRSIAAQAQNLLNRGKLLLSPTARPKFIDLQQQIDDLNNLQAEINRLTADVDSSDREMDSISDQLDPLRRDIKTQLDLLRKKLALMKLAAFRAPSSRIATPLQSEVDDVDDGCEQPRDPRLLPPREPRNRDTSELDQLRKENSELLADLDYATEELETLRQELQRKSQQIAVAQDQCERALDKARKFDAAYHAQKDKADQLEDELDQALHQKEELEGKLNEAEEAALDAARSLAELEKNKLLDELDHQQVLTEAQAAAQTAQEEVAGLKQLLADKEKQIAALQEAAKSRSDGLEEMGAELARLTNAHAQVKEALAKLTQEHADLQKELRDKNAAHASAERVWKEATRAIRAEQEKERQDHAEALAKLEKELADAQTAAQEAAAKAEELQPQLQAQKDEVERLAAIGEQQVEALEAAGKDKRALEDQLQALKVTLEQESAKIEPLQREVAQAQQAQQQAIAHAEQLTAELAELASVKDENSDLANQLREAQTRAQNAQTLAQQKANDVQQLEVELQQLRAQQQQALADGEANQNLQEELVTQGQALSSLEAQVQALTAEAEQARTEAQQAQTLAAEQQAALQATIEELRQENTDKDQNLSQLAASTAEAVTAHQEAQAEVQQLAEQLQKQQQLVQSLQDAAREKAAEASNNAGAMQQLQAELAATKEKLAKVQADFDAFKAKEEEKAKARQAAQAELDEKLAKQGEHISKLNESMQAALAEGEQNVRDIEALQLGKEEAIQRADQLQQTLDDTRAELDRLKTESAQRLQAQKEEIAEARRLLAEGVANLKSLISTLENTTKEKLDQANAKIEKQQKLVASLQQKVTEKTKSFDAERLAFEEKIRKLQDQLAELTKQHLKVKKERRELAQRLALATVAVQKLQKDVERQKKLAQIMETLAKRYQQENSKLRHQLKQRHIENMTPGKKFTLEDLYANMAALSSVRGSKILGPNASALDVIPPHILAGHIDCLLVPHDPVMVNMAKEALKELLQKEGSPEHIYNLAIYIANGVADIEAFKREELFGALQRWMVRRAWTLGKADNLVARRFTLLLALAKETNSLCGQLHGPISEATLYHAALDTQEQSKRDWGRALIKADPTTLSPQKCMVRDTLIKGLENAERGVKPLVNPAHATYSPIKDHPLRDTYSPNLSLVEQARGLPRETESYLHKIGPQSEAAWNAIKNERESIIDSTIEAFDRDTIIKGIISRSTANVHSATIPSSRTPPALSEPLLVKTQIPHSDCLAGTLKGHRPFGRKERNEVLGIIETYGLQISERLINVLKGDAAIEMADLQILQVMMDPPTISERLAAARASGNPLSDADREGLLHAIEGRLRTHLNDLTDLVPLATTPEALMRYVQENGQFPPAIRQALTRQGGQGAYIVAQLLYYYNALREKPTNAHFQHIAALEQWDWLTDGLRTDGDRSEQLLMLLQAIKTNFNGQPISSQQADWARNFYALLTDPTREPPCIDAVAGSGKTALCHFIVNFIKVRKPKTTQNKRVILYCPYATKVTGMDWVKLENTKKNTIFVRSEAERDNVVVVVDEAHMLEPDAEFIVEVQGDARCAKRIVKPLLITATPIKPFKGYAIHKGSSEQDKIKRAEASRQTESPKPFRGTFESLQLKVSGQLHELDQERSKEISRLRRIEVQRLATALLPALQACSYNATQKFISHRQRASYKLAVETLEGTLHRIAENQSDADAAKDYERLTSEISKLRDLLQEAAPQHNIGFKEIGKLTKEDNPYYNLGDYTAANAILRQECEAARTRMRALISQLSGLESWACKNDYLGWMESDESPQLGLLKQRNELVKLQEFNRRIQALQRTNREVGGKLTTWNTKAAAELQKEKLYMDARASRSAHIQKHMEYRHKTLQQAVPSSAGRSIAQDLLSIGLEKLPRAQVIMPQVLFTKEAALLDFTNAMARELAAPKTGKPMMFVYHDSHSDPQDPKSGKDIVIMYDAQGNRKKDLGPSRDQDYITLEELLRTAREQANAKYPAAVKEMATPISRDKYVELAIRRSLDKFFTIMLYDTTFKQGGDFDLLSTADADDNYDMHQVLYYNLKMKDQGDPADTVSMDDLYQAMSRRRGHSKQPAIVYASCASREAFGAKLQMRQTYLEQGRAVYDVAGQIARKVIKALEILDNPQVTSRDPEYLVHLEDGEVTKWKAEKAKILQRKNIDKLTKSAVAFLKNPNAAEASDFRVQWEALQKRMDQAKIDERVLQADRASENLWKAQKTFLETEYLIQWARNYTPPSAQRQVVPAAAVGLGLTPRPIQNRSPAAQAAVATPANAPVFVRPDVTGREGKRDLAPGAKSALLQTTTSQPVQMPGGVD